MAAADDTSCFLKLFVRGRYVTSRSIAQREASSEDPQRKHEERERFAVAAIAFCINHDSQFRGHFLKVVANLENADIDRVDVEPKRWGDLVLEGKRDVVVLEFKLKALLAEHQDPNKSRFVSEGYGFDIRKEYGDKRKILYVVVGKDVLSGQTKNGIPYHGLPWSAFLLKDRGETRIERDLFNCLAVLGVPIFLTRNMKKKNLSTEAMGAMEIYQLLNAVADDIRTKANSGIDSVGLDLRVAGAGAKRLSDIVAPQQSSLGWIGYEQIERQLCLSVWFYSSEKASKAVHNSLRALEASRQGSVVTDQTFVGFQMPAADVGDHKTWFDDVLQTVAGK